MYLAFHFLLLCYIGNIIESVLMRMIIDADQPRVTPWFAWLRLGSGATRVCPWVSPYLGGLWANAVHATWGRSSLPVTLRCLPNPTWLTRVRHPQSNKCSKGLVLQGPGIQKLPEKGHLLTGLQIFSPWAEFSPWEINFCHSWDQRKSVEKKFSIWGGGVGVKISCKLTWKQFFHYLITKNATASRGSAPWSPAKDSALGSPSNPFPMAPKFLAVRVLAIATALFSPYELCPFGGLGLL